MERKEKITFILFGGTGDLTKRKLVPAFADLVHRGKLDKSSSIIGISRKEWSDEEYKDFLVSGIKDEREKKHIKNLKIKHLSADFSKKDGLKGLQPLVSVCEPGKKCSRVYYLSTSFKFFGNIVRELEKYGLDDQSGGFTRIVFEKPFGSDLESSNKLDKEIHSVFDEEEVYRIDHYLAKETVQNLNVLKFSNPLLYSTLNKEYVESVEIRVDESLGVGNRLGYYNDSGALKDMIQNHLLQVLSLVLMRRPGEIKAENVHDEKVKILKNLELKSSKEQLLGQYKSYKKELKDSGLKDKGTETFAKIVLNCKTKEWDGVDLILRTGKKLEKKFGQITINFKELDKVKHSWTGVSKNKIEIGIYPKLDVNLVLNTRDPENSGKIEPVNFEFCRECKFGPNTSDEYAVLLGEVIRGEKILFSRSDEVKESWKIVEEVLRNKKKIKFVQYDDCTDPEK